MAIQDSGSNYDYYQGVHKAKLNFSNFDLSYLNSFNCNFGVLRPCYFQETLPRTRVKLSNQILVFSNPMVSRLLSRVRIFVHYYWQPYSTMWHLWEAFMKKGNRGKYQTSIPKWKPYNSTTSTWNTGVDSLWNMFGLPLNAETDIVEAFIAFMYQNIYRWYYLNPNVLTEQDVDTWFPHDETQFTLDASDQEFVSGTDGKIRLDEVRYRNYVDDRFTSALLSPQRGDAPTITMAGNITQMTIDSLTASGNILIPSRNISVSSTANLNSNLVASGDSSLLSFGMVPSNGTTYSNSSIVAKQSNQTVSVTLPVSGSVTGSDITVATSISTDTIRNMFTTQLELERMARTDGTYRQFMQSFYGEIPSHANDHRPVYIGGTYQPLVVQEVLQTSADTQVGESSVSPLGNRAGSGVSASNGEVGTFYADDYGMIMGIMSIMPDTYYAQGIPAIMTRNTQEDFWLPGREKLGMEAILNQEVFYKNGNDGTSTSQNQGVFAWQNRYDSYRYRENIVSGKMADPTNTFWSTMVQTRYFSDLPTLSEDFVTTKDNVNMNAWYGGNSEDPFIVQIANRCIASEPLPYRSIPQGL